MEKETQMTRWEMEKETQMTMWWEKKKEKKNKNKKKNKKKIFIFITDDILVDIFSRLPVKSLLRIKQTCKHWFDLVRDPDFVKMHLHRSTSCAATGDYRNTSLFFVSRISSLDFYFVNCTTDLNYYSSPPKTDQFDYFKLPRWFGHHTIGPKEKDDHSKIVRSGGSCNGLIFLYRLCHDYGFDYEYFLWNPSTRELKKLPYRNDKSHRILHSLCFHGFGYDHTIDDYKVIQIVWDFLNSGDQVLYSKIIINIYTLGSNSWSTKIPTDQLDLGDFRVENTGDSYEGCFFNGSLHWIWEPAIISMSLDTVEVEHPQLQLPNNGDTSSKLEVLNGCLCVINYVWLKDWNSIVEFWMMKDYGVNESWTKLFTMDSRKLTSMGVCSIFNRSYLKHLKPIELCKDGSILMVFNKGYLVLYDLKNEKHRWVHRIEDSMIDNIACFDYVLGIESYAESLVSLKSGVFLTAAGSTTTVQNLQGRKRNRPDSERRRRE